MNYVPPFGNPFVMDEDYDAPDTDPTPPVKKDMQISDEYVPLFTSALWVIRARIGGKIVAESSEINRSHTQTEVRQWARAFIRKEHKNLYKLGALDVIDDYVKVWGGRAIDI